MIFYRFSIIFFAFSAKIELLKCWFEDCRRRTIPHSQTVGSMEQRRGPPAHAQHQVAPLPFRQPPRRTRTVLQPHLAQGRPLLGPQPARQPLELQMRLAANRRTPNRQQPNLPHPAQRPRRQPRQNRPHLLRRSLVFF